MKNEINIVIGSWGSYNAGNERCYGSKWFCLNDYTDWEDIVEELKKQGFELNGIDEELFVQDIEGIPTDGTNWDYVNPQQLFETLQESGILDDEYKYELFEAYCEVEGFPYWEKRVESRGSHWDDDVYIYNGFNWYDLGYQFLHDGGAEIPEYLDNYIDYERYGEQYEDDGYHECNAGIIYIG